MVLTRAYQNTEDFQIQFQIILYFHLVPFFQITCKDNVVHSGLKLFNEC